MVSILFLLSLFSFLSPFLYFACSPLPINSPLSYILHSLIHKVHLVSLLFSFSIAWTTGMTVGSSEPCYPVKQIWGLKPSTENDREETQVIGDGGATLPVPHKPF